MAKDNKGDADADQQIGDDGISRPIAHCIRSQQGFDVPFQQPGGECPHCIERNRCKDSDHGFARAGKGSLAYAVPGTITCCSGRRKLKGACAP